MPIALDLADAAALAALHVAAEWAALVLALLLGGAAYLISAMAYRG